jgi:hypothetical protein
MCGEFNLKPERKVQFGRTTSRFRDGCEIGCQGEDLISLLQDKNH